MNLLGKEVVMNDGKVGDIIAKVVGKDLFHIELQDDDMEFYTVSASPEDFNYAEVVMQETMKMIDEVIENLEEVERHISDYHDASKFSRSIDRAEMLRDYLKSIDN